jgi:hypothetical protein
MSRNSISTKGEIIHLLLDGKLPEIFTHTSLRPLLPHRSSGAISGALSTLVHKDEVLKTWGTPKARKFKIAPFITSLDLRNVTYGSECHRPLGIQRRTLRGISQYFSHHKLSAAGAPVTLETVRGLFETTLTKLGEIEQLLLTLEQEAALSHITPRSATAPPTSSQREKKISKVPPRGIASSLESGHNNNRGENPKRPF